MNSFVLVCILCDVCESVCLCDIFNMCEAVQVCLCVCLFYVFDMCDVCI